MILRHLAAAASLVLIGAFIVRLGAPLVPAQGRVPSTEFYVSPEGSPSGDGTQNAPWDLSTALEQPDAVAPGSTIWLRGGVYRGTFASDLTGWESSPIIVRQYPGERATIDSGEATGPAALTVRGSDTWYWGFEVTRFLQCAANGAKRI